MVVNDMLRPRTMATGRYLPRFVDEATMAGSKGNTQGEKMLMSPAPNAISGFTSVARLLSDVCYLRASSMALFSVLASKSPINVAVAPSFRTTIVVGVFFTAYAPNRLEDVALSCRLKCANV